MDKREQQMLPNYLQGSSPLLSPKENQGVRIQRVGLEAIDREDTLGFGPDRATVTIVAALGAGHCPENGVGDLTASYKRPSVVCWEAGLDGFPLSPQVAAQCVQAGVASPVICSFPYLQMGRRFCMLVV